MVEWVTVHLMMKWKSLDEEGRGSVSKVSVLEVDATSPSIHITITDVSWDGALAIEFFNLSRSPK